MKIDRLRFRFEMMDRICVCFGCGLVMLAPVTDADANPPPAPPGFKWVVNEAFTDEFNGASLDLNKWYDYHPTWVGRAPAKFMPWTISVTNGFMQIQNDVLNPPEGSFNIAGGAVVSRSTAAYYGYYEVRMKASKISMSSTFWMSNGNATDGGVTASQEIDIQETIGAPHATPTWAANWHKRMNSNTHYKHSSGGSNTLYSVGDDVVVSPPSPQTGEDFHVYGAWWVDPNTVHFYHNNQFVYTVHPATNIVPQPFDRPMHINMVTETYDWMAPPAVEDLTNSAINTTYYDWIRAYVLVDENAPEPVPAVVWKDQLPQSAASIFHGPLAAESGVADPLGGTNLASRIYYSAPTHAEYRNIGINSGVDGFQVAGLDTAVRVPLGGGYQYASIDGGYRGRPFTFSAEVYVPASSPLGNDVNDQLSIFVRWQNSGGGNLVFTSGPGANLANHGSWQTLSMSGTSPADPAVVRVVPIVSTRDAGLQIGQDTTIYHLRNIRFELLGPPLPPTLHHTVSGGDLVLEWQDSYFKLQFQSLSPGSGLGGGWMDHPLPAGTNPPVTVPLDSAGGGVLYRLAPQ